MILDQHERVMETTADIVDRLATLGAGYDAAPNFPCDSLAVLVESGHHRRFAEACGGFALKSAARMRYGEDLARGGTGRP
jgi:hypothetical protein